MGMEALLMRWLFPYPFGTAALAALSRSAQTSPIRASEQRLAVTSPKAAFLTAGPSIGINLGIKLLSSTLQRN